MNLDPMDTLVNSRIGLNLVIFFARITPPWLGKTIAGMIACLIASRPDSEMVRAVTANQHMASGDNLPSKTLEQRVLRMFQHSARSVFDLYHHIDDLDSADHLFVVDPSFQPLIGRPKFAEQGLVAAGLHMSGFDLALQWLCYKYLAILGLTIPSPEGGRGVEFEIRKRILMELIPGSFNGLRQAIRYLKRGGLVATGIDRPDPDYPLNPRFFGFPASLPTHHIFLALKARVPMIVVTCRLEADGCYHLIASPPIEMDHYPNRDDELLYNGEKVLSVAEDIIRMAPDQWLISLPVWPEVLKPSLK